MRKVTSSARKPSSEPIGILTEQQAKQNIILLPLESKSLHDRIGEMLQTIGSRMEYNTFTRYKVTPLHKVELDVAWLKGRNPEVAIEIQIGGNITEAKEKLSQARKFNYRKVIMVIEESQLDDLNEKIKFDELRNWLDAWSIQSIYKLYTSGIAFMDLYQKLMESQYRNINEIEIIKE